MKPLIVSIVAVAAATLWFSEAEARESGRHSSARSSHQASYQHQHQSKNQNRHQWNRHGDNGRQWGRNHSDNGRHLGQSRNGDRDHGDRNRFSRNGYDGRSVNQAQWSQRERIQHASRDGDLTRGERKSLWGEQRAIAAKERAYRSDGQFTRAERKDIGSDLKIASRHIYNESHDADRRNDR